MSAEYVRPGTEDYRIKIRCWQMISALTRYMLPSEPTAPSDDSLTQKIWACMLRGNVPVVFQYLESVAARLCLVDNAQVDTMARKQKNIYKYNIITSINITIV